MGRQYQLPQSSRHHTVVKTRVCPAFFLNCLVHNHARHARGCYRELITSSPAPRPGLVMISGEARIDCFPALRSLRTGRIIGGLHSQLPMRFSRKLFSAITAVSAACTTATTQTPPAPAPSTAVQHSSHGKRGTSVAGTCSSPVRSVSHWCCCIRCSITGCSDC